LKCSFFNIWYTNSLCLSSRAVCKKFGLHVSRMMLAFLVLSAGMFCSSSGKETAGSAGSRLSRHWFYLSNALMLGSALLSTFSLLAFIIILWYK
jgi:hypothetical protein